MNKFSHDRQIECTIVEAITGEYQHGWLWVADYDNVIDASGVLDLASHTASSRLASLAPGSS